MGCPLWAGCYGLPNPGKWSGWIVKLDASMLIEHLENRKIMIAFPDTYPIAMGPEERIRKVINGKVVKNIEAAEKYIFDSGSDTDPETTNAVRSTSTAMMEGKLFHMPSKITWIEDPFDADDQNDKELFTGRDLRNYYLCIEENDGIEVWFFNSIPPGHGEDGKIRFSMFALPMFLDLTQATDKFAILGIEREPLPLYVTGLAEAIYSVKKFVVTLATKDQVREKVKAKPQKARIPRKFREFDHTIIRVPFDRAESQSLGLGLGGTGRKRRKHLVPGYWWGKNTRELPDRRFIWPYWRGSQEVGVIDPAERHHVVKTKPAARA